MTRPPRSTAASRDSVGVEQHQHAKSDRKNRAEGGANVEPGGRARVIGTTIEPSIESRLGVLGSLAPPAVKHRRFRTFGLLRRASREADHNVAGHSSVAHRVSLVLPSPMLA